jgi:predicted Zn-dependent peptidase
VFAVRSLDNGVRVALDSSLAVRSVTICVSIEAGARYDEPGSLGLAHLLEHVVMAAPVKEAGGVSLAEWVDLVGGQSNASTSHEAVAFWARVPPAAAVDCMRVLDRAVAAPATTDQLCASERLVVVQELLAASADPIDVAEEFLYGSLFRDQPLGRPVGGAAGDFPAFTAQDVISAHHRNLRCRPISIAMVGHEEILGEAFSVLRDGALASVERETKPPQQDAPVVRGGRRRSAALLHRRSTPGCAASSGSAISCVPCIPRTATSGCGRSSRVPRPDTSTSSSRSC